MQRLVDQQESVPCLGNFMTRVCSDLQCIGMLRAMVHNRCSVIYKLQLHLIIALEEIVEVFPFSDEGSGRVNPVTAGLLECAFSPAQHFANCLHHTQSLLK